MPPKSFGKYEVLARLATGGAANIFLARQPGAAGFHKLVCLKTLLPERASDEDFVAMFLDEARLAARLNHPNCVQIYDLGRVRGVYYISMEYIFGDTLWNLLTTVTKLRTPLPTSHVAAIIANACDGLHHAHELKDSEGKKYNLVHRDVSPQNIMITFEGQTKVVDFGIAKAETGRAPTIAGIVKGKFSYMSPEQITGGSVDRRSDIYSLGIVFFECLASRRLYRGDSPEDIARLILEHRAPRLKDVVPDMPAELDEICAKALSRHPSKRFQTALEMGDALRDYLDSIRYNQSASSLSKLLDERFKDKIPQRRRVFEAALAGSLDEAELVKALEARVVRNLDLFPDEVDLDDSKDFSETTGAWAESERDPPDSPTNEQLDESPESSSGQHVGDGFRVQLEEQSSGRERISMLGGGSLLGNETEQGDSDATSVDMDGTSEDLTRIDPEVVDPAEQKPEALTEDVVAAADPDHMSDSTRVDVVTDEYEEDSWSSDQTKTDDEFDEKTPFEGDPLVPEDAPPSRDLGVVVGPASKSGNGVVVRRSKQSVTKKPPPPPTDTREEILLPTKEERALSEADAFETPRADSAEAMTSPPVPAANIEDTVEPPAPPVPVEAPEETSPPVRAVSVPATSFERRYTLAALLAAMGFGISFGLVAGMLLARLIFPGG